MMPLAQGLSQYRQHKQRSILLSLVGVHPIIERRAVKRYKKLAGARKGEVAFKLLASIGPFRRK